MPFWVDVYEESALDVGGDVGDFDWIDSICPCSATGWS
jgi:hypothetical protein